MVRAGVQTDAYVAAFTCRLAHYIVAAVRLLSPSYYLHPFPRREAPMPTQKKNFLRSHHVMTAVMIVGTIVTEIYAAIRALDVFAASPPHKLT